jgi:hypothetical protein
MPSEQTGNKSLEGFQRLGNGISFYRPDTISPAIPDKSPSLVILATWFAALPRHVSKYTETYKTIFPGAAILILPTSIPDMIYRSYSTQQKNLAPALPIVLEYSRQPDQEILLHIFSNSGAHTACQLARAYRSHAGSGLKVGALILDSAPGINTYRGITNGFIAGLPSTPVMKELLSLLAYGLVGLIMLKEAVTGEDHFIQKFRKDLNDKGFFRSDRGRVYIYGKEDKIVRSEDVERHAKEAEGKDIGEVRLHLWENSGHVGHMAKDGEKYWDIVRKLWVDEPTIKSRL